MDIIKLDVPLFIRLLELAREEVDNDADLHDIAEIVTYLSEDHIVTMHDYNTIVDYMEQTGAVSKKENDSDELDTIKRLGGL